MGGRRVRKRGLLQTVGEASGQSRRWAGKVQHAAFRGEKPLRGRRPIISAVQLGGTALLIPLGRGRHPQNARVLPLTGASAVPASSTSTAAAEDVKSVPAHLPSCLHRPWPLVAILLAP